MKKIKGVKLFLTHETSIKKPIICPLLSTNIKTVHYTGHLIPCCEFRLKEDPESLHSFPLLSDAALKKNAKFSQLKGQLLAGEWPEECIRCRESEESGAASLRQQALEYQRTIKGSKILNLRLGNLCQLSCTTCSPLYSSSLSTESPVMTLSRDNFDLLVKLVFEFQPTSIYLSGGEPLLHPSHRLFLEQILDKGIRPQLAYSTNLLAPHAKIESLIGIWKMFPDVHFQVSIDGDENLNPKIRSGSDMGLLETNLNRVRKEFSVSINTVVSALNAFELTSLFKYVEQKLNFSAEEHSLSTLSFPEHLSLKKLDHLTKRDLEINLRETLERYPQRSSQIRSLIRFIQ